ncbi:MAG: hypothetical protein EBU90_13520 [Proteobacteria bacterium]|nr:hypothetical protein [Pseudomonadota bacterium]
MFQKELKQSMSEDNRAAAENIIRHAVLSTIKSYRKKFGQEYGEMVIACDGPNYWRRDFYPQYKANRAKAREKSDLDWSLVFDCLHALKQDLNDHFPYKVLNIDKCEADDIIAVLTSWSQDNNLVQTGLVETPQPILILSSDHDFGQLQKYTNVRQWSPMQKKFVIEKQPLKYVIEHTVRGDSGDGVPSIYCADDFFVNKEQYGKAPSVTAKKLALFLDNGFDACQNDTERRNWHRNQTLVDFNFIPKEIKDSIVNTYTTKTITGDRNSVFNYLVKHKCRMLLDSIEEF